MKKIPIRTKDPPLHQEALKIISLIKETPGLATTIDFYKVGKILGRGAFGKVNLALHRLTRKLVAIKSTALTLQDEHEKKKVLHEIEILKLLKHESFIKLLETFNTAQNMCIVMELCPGGDLLAYVRKRRKIPEV